MQASITVDGKTYKIDASHYDTVDVENGYVVFWKSGYGTTSVKIAEEGAGDAEALEAISELTAKLHDKEKVEKCDS